MASDEARMSTDTSNAAVERLALEYRDTMAPGVVHSWAQDVVPTLRALLAEREALDALIGGLDALIGRMQAQDVAAIQQWQAAHPGNDLVWPDQIRLTAWCMGEVARWRDECERLRLGGCARGQTTTQWCAEAVQMMAERDAAIERRDSHWRSYGECHRMMREAQRERDAARAEAERMRDALQGVIDAASVLLDYSGPGWHPISRGEYRVEGASITEARAALAGTEGARDG